MTALSSNAGYRFLRGFYLDEFLRQEKFDIFLDHREFFNIGRFRRSQERDHFRNQNFRGRCTSRNPDRLGLLKPRGIDVGG